MSAVASEHSSSKVKTLSLENIHPKLRSSPLSGPARPFTTSGGPRSSPKTVRVITAEAKSRQETQCKAGKNRPEWNSSTLDTLYTPRRDRDKEAKDAKKGAQEGAYAGEKVGGEVRMSSSAGTKGGSAEGNAALDAALGTPHPGKVVMESPSSRERSRGEIPPRAIPPARGGEKRRERSQEGMRADGEEESGGEATIPAAFADLERPQSRRGDPTGDFAPVSERPGGCLVLDRWMEGGREG